MKIQDALDLHLKEEASRIIGESQGNSEEGVVIIHCTDEPMGLRNSTTGFDRLHGAGKTFFHGFRIDFDDAVHTR